MGRPANPTALRSFRYRQFGCKPLRRRLLTVQNFRGNVNIASEHQLNGAEHDLTFLGFWDEAQSAKLESARDYFLVIRGRENNDWNSRIAVAQIGEHREAVSIRQIDIKQNEAKVGMFLDDAHRIMTVRSFKYEGLAWIL